MVTGDARLGQPLHRIQHLHSTVSTVIYSIYLQYSAMMDSEALRVRLFVAQSRLRHSQGSDWYISLDIFVLENTKNQAYALRIPALRCTRLIIALRIICLSVISSSSGNSEFQISCERRKKDGVTLGDMFMYLGNYGTYVYHCNQPPRDSTLVINWYCANYGCFS